MCILQVGSFKTADFNPITNCSNCGAPKVLNRTNEESECTCRNYFCTLDLCPYETTDVKLMWTHRNMHKTNKDIPVDYATSCKCGTAKTPVAGESSWKCTNPICPLVHCLHPNCFMCYKYDSDVWQNHNAEQHTVLVPYHQRDKLCSCGEPKVRQPIGWRPGVGQCQKCNIYWCIVKNCKFEKFRLNILSTHANRCS